MVAENSIDWRCAGRAAATAPDVADEAEVEHPVGLVEHEVAHLVEPQMARVHQVADASRRADHDVGAAAHPLLLRAAADAAHHDRALRAAGRRRNRGSRPRSAGRARAWAPGSARGCRTGGRGGGRCQVLQDRQREGGGLAGAGLRDAEQVAAGQQRGDGAGLDRRGRGEAAASSARSSGPARPSEAKSGEIMSRWSSARPCGIDARWRCPVVRQPHVTTGGPIADEMSRGGATRRCTGANYAPWASGRLHRRLGAKTQAPSRRVRAG